MNLYHTHVCLVSAQAAPNLLPLLDDSLKPKKVILLVTPQMRDKADYLSAVIMPRGIQVVIHHLKNAEAYDLIQDEILEILSEEKPDNIALNATGGTKWMSLAAVDTFRMNGSPVFYVDINSDQILFLEKNEPAHKLTQNIKLTSYLNAYGYEVTNKDQAQPQGLTKDLSHFCRELVMNVSNWGNAIGKLNRIASEADNNNTLVGQLNDLDYKDSQFSTLLKACLAANLIDEFNIDTIVFKSQETRQLANGGWIEDYVNSLLNELKGKGKIQDSPKLNLCIKKVGSKKPHDNELDVAFMAKNRLHIIECKTKNFKGRSIKQAGSETLYKLDSISDLGGLGTKAMLVSYRELSKPDQQRAKDLKIKVVEGRQIQQLKSELESWLG
jgi:hypothetical protein